MLKATGKTNGDEKLVRLCKIWKVKVLGVGKKFLSIETRISVFFTELDELKNKSKLCWSQSKLLKQTKTQKKNHLYLFQN